MKKYFLSFLVLFFISLAAVAQNSPQNQLMAVVFHADWCPYCPQLVNKVETINVDIQEVEFVKLDFTNKETKKAAKAIAQERNLTHLLEKYKGTGFLVLIDAITKEELVRLSAKDSQEDIQAAFEKYVSQQ